MGPLSARAEVSGTYKTQGQNIKVAIQSWGDDCGPRPRSHASGGGKVIEVRSVGSHLSLGGHRTDQCWSRNPRVRRVRATAGTSRWVVVCETSSGDPRFEHGEYVVELVNEKTLRFREVSRYDWRLEGDHCKATVTLTRNYLRTSSAGDTAPENTSSDPQPPAKCRGNRGSAVKLEVRPSRARVGPGDKICFRAIARDREGCPVPVDSTWAVAQSSRDQNDRLDASGCFVAGTSGSGGRVVIIATASQLTAKAQVEIRVPDIGDLVAARLAEGIDDQEDAAPAAEARPGAAQGVGETSVGPVRENQGVLWAVVAVGLGAAVFLLLVAVVLWRRRQREIEMIELASDGNEASMAVASSVPPPSLPSLKICPACKQEFADAIEFCPDDATKLVAATRSGGGRHGQSLICPRCRRGYESDERFCSRCSEELVPYAVWRASQIEARRSVDAVTGGMICPKCAARYDQGILFCQKDGTKLEPIN